jgi:urease accessory protein
LAHGAEMPANAGSLQYGLGFIGATALLHLIGIGFSSVASGRFSLATRIAGAGVTAAGVMLLLN